MARKMTEWPSKRGPITKIMPSDGCKGDAVPLAVGQWYDFHKFECHPGNVGLVLDGLFAPLPMTTLVAEPFFGCYGCDPKVTAFIAFFLFPARFTKCGIFLALRAPPFN
jgi:hypothetical protein